MPPSRARARSASSTAATTSRCWSSGSTTWSRRRRWRRHYRQIRDWERTLTEEGVTILKFFLAIDKDEQRQRFQERVDDPTKRWKFALGDLDERKLWDKYRAAFEEMLEETEHDYAPWYLIPANRNWLRNLAVSEIVADTLDDLTPRYPEPEAGIEGVKVV